MSGPASKRKTKPPRIVDRTQIALRVGLVALVAGVAFWFLAGPGAATRDEEDTTKLAQQNADTDEAYEQFMLRARWLHDGDSLDHIRSELGKYSDYKRSPHFEHYVWNGPKGASLECDVDNRTGIATRVRLTK